MLYLSTSCKYLYRNATDMREGFDGLCGIVSSQLGMSGLNGSVLIFINKKQTQVKLLLWGMRRPGCVLQETRLSTGTLTSCVVDIKLLTSLAFHCMCTDLMIVHNHPSGNLKASNYDQEITLKVKAALELIEVQFIDHLIIIEI